MSWKSADLFKGLFVCLCAVLCVTSAQAGERAFGIGMVLPLSGSVAENGIAVKNSIELARSDRPDLFANLAFVFRDTKSDTSNAVSAYHVLREIKGVDVIYIWGSPPCKLLSPIVEVLKFPTIGHCSDPKASVGRDYFMLFMDYDDEYMKTMAEYLAMRGMKKLGIAIANNPYLESLYEAFQRNLIPGQTITVVDKLAATDMSSIRSTVSKIKKDNFDAVGVFLGPGQIGHFYKRKMEQKLEVPTFGTHFFESGSEIEASAGGMEGAVFPSIPIRIVFADRYKSRFGNENQLAFGAQAYEFAMMMGRLFGREKEELSSEEIMERIKSVKSEPGVATGPYYFRTSKEAGSYFKFPIVIKRVTNGKFEEIGGGL